MRAFIRAVLFGLVLSTAFLQPLDAQISTPSGALGVSTESTQATYHCSGFVTPAAAPTDIITLSGSGTKTIHITQVRITVESTTSGVADILLLRRSTADTGGTSSTPAIGKMATANAAATAVCTVYTANPTTGTLVANLDAAKQSGGQGNPVTFIYGQNTQSLILSGTTDILAVNGNGDTLLTGEAIAFMLEWEEY